MFLSKKKSGQKHFNTPEKFGQQKSGKNIGVQKLLCLKDFGSEKF